MDIRNGLLPLAALAIGCALAMPLHAQDAPEPALGTVIVDAMAPAPGQFHWTPHVAPAGQALVVVSLPEQRAYVYRAGTLIGVSSVSTGTAAKPTPTGIFEILQKKASHRSNLYNDAPMPFMQRLTWDGIALHAGHVTGKPASHGCVRLPLEFAKLLFAETEKGGIVVIADEASHPAEVVYPDARAPVDTYTGQPLISEETRVADSMSPATTPELPRAGTAALPR